MSTLTTNSQSHSGNRISERATRGAMAQFRSAAAKGAPSTRDAANDRRDIRRSAIDPQILRRWRIADLIAAASRRGAFA
jgi:hypothetical protein